MKLHDLQPAPGSTQGRKRKGRGIGSGMGKTATRGHKGQWARSGGGVRPGFQGGQMPLMRRLPKRGFTNAPFKKDYAELNARDLNQFEDGTEVTFELLVEMGLCPKHKDGFRVLGNGEVRKKLTVIASGITEKAKEKIEAAGGKAEVK